MKNILIILADHLSWKALPAYGNTFVKTPNIDRIAKNSVIFENCYTPCPLCLPARASLQTSKHCHQTDILANGRLIKNPSIPETMPTLGEIFKNAGYETIHFGKTHDCKSLRGFDIIPEKFETIENEYDAFPLWRDSYYDEITTNKFVTYMHNRDNSKPFLAVADLFNPHDICSYVGQNMYHHKKIALPDGFELPPLPDNFEFTDIENRSKSVQFICCSHNRQAPVSSWDDEDFRHYLATFYYYVTLLNHKVGMILDSLEQNGYAQNTLIVLCADHGDGMVARAKVTGQTHE